jgi:hypothetical protein
VAPLVLVVLYNLALPVMAQARGHHEVVQMWTFLLPLSIFLLFPDWMLSAKLGLLHFSEHDWLHFGTVSAYRAFIWTIPLFLVVFIGSEIEKYQSTALALAAMLLSAIVLFVLEEEALFQLGAAHISHAATLFHAGWHVLIPQVLMGFAAFFAWQQVHCRNFLSKLFAAFIVMLIYTGGVAFCYFFLFEG